MHNVLLEITGIHCASCIPEIQEGLLKLEGVSKAIINPATGKAEITFDSTKQDKATIIRTIEALGYRVTNSAMKKPVSNQPLLHRLLLGAAISVLVFIMDALINFPYEGYMQLFLSLVVLSYTGQEFYKKGIPALLRGRPNMDSLVALGVSTSFIYSSYLVIFSQSTHYYFMDTVFISTFIIFGRYLEARSKGEAKQAMNKLLTLGAKQAHLKTGKDIHDIPSNSIQRGDLLLVKPGEKIPADGILMEGEATIDESMITGESIPIEKKSGHQLIGATINTTTSFTMKATKRGEESLLAQMAKMVEQAQLHKAPIQKLVDLISKYFVWSVLFIALITYATWFIATGNSTDSIIPAVAVIIIACPCALGLATPISLVVASGRGSEMGILIKDPSVLEKAYKITAIAFDKTGTITEGTPVVVDTYIPENKQKIMSYAAALEGHSEHPLAKAISTLLPKTNLPRVSHVKSHTGGGIVGSIDDQTILMGSNDFLKKHGITLKPALQTKAISWQQQGYTLVYLAIATNVLGIFALQDKEKIGVKATMEMLKKKGIRRVMLTGDNEIVADQIARRVGIDEVHAHLLPGQKQEIIKTLQRNGEVVAMIGDGINDAPALASADIGIALGGGTDIAMESGDLILIHGDITKAVTALNLSRITMTNIKQNLFWAFLYNILGIPLAAFGLLNPMLSAIAMSLSSVSVVYNALRIKRVSLSRD